MVHLYGPVWLWSSPPSPSPIDKTKSLFFEGVEGILWLGFELCSPNFHHIRERPMHTVGTCRECARVRTCAVCVQFPHSTQQGVLHIWSVQELSRLPMPTKSAFSTSPLLLDLPKTMHHMELHACAACLRCVRMYMRKSLKIGFFQNFQNLTGKQL